MSVRLKSSEKLELIDSLGAMLSAGIPLLESVEALLENAKSRNKAVLESLKKDLEGGKTIADSFSRFPDSFDPIALNLIRGGEEAGNLEEILAGLADTIRKDIDFTRKIKTALAYPLFVIATFAVIMTVILAFVIPRIGDVFSKLDVNIPLPTKILIFLSNALLNYWPWIILCLFILCASIFFFYQAKRKEVLYLLSSLPLLSNLAREIDLVRFSRSLGLLLASGIPISKSLELSQHVLVRKELIHLIEFARKEVIRGKRLTDALNNKNGIMPQIFIRMIDAGERSGKLEQSFQKTAAYFDDRVSATIKTLTTLMEPILLVIIGLIVGGIMLSIIAPIYQLISSISVSR